MRLVGPQTSSSRWAGLTLNETDCLPLDMLNRSPDRDGAAANGQRNMSTGQRLQMTRAPPMPCAIGF